MVVMCGWVSKCSKCFCRGHKTGIWKIPHLTRKRLSDGQQAHCLTNHQNTHTCPDAHTGARIHVAHTHTNVYNQALTHTHIHSQALRHTNTQTHSKFQKRTHKMQHILSVMKPLPAASEVETSNLGITVWAFLCLCVSVRLIFTAGGPKRGEWFV